MPKPRSAVDAAIAEHKSHKAEPIPKDIKALVDKPYDGVQEVEPKMRNVSITLPVALTEKLQDVAIVNKRGGGSLTSVSAIIRDALEKAGYTI